MFSSKANSLFDTNPESTSYAFFFLAFHAIYLVMCAYSRYSPQSMLENLLQSFYLITYLSTNIFISLSSYLIASFSSRTSWRASQIHQQTLNNLALLRSYVCRNTPAKTILALLGWQPNCELSSWKHRYLFCQRFCICRLYIPVAQQYLPCKTW